MGEILRMAVRTSQCFLLAAAILLGLNDAEGSGGGIAMRSGAKGLRMANCRIINNQSQSDDPDGAGAYFENAGDVTLTNCVFADNSGLRNGGAIYVGSGTAAKFVNCVIARNETEFDGAGIYNIGDLVLVNCTLAGNSTKDLDDRDGGALYQHENGTASITNCIFWGNMQGKAAGGATQLEPNDIHVQVGATVGIAYSCLKGTGSPNLTGSVTLGDGIITDDPLFAGEYDDLHLKSRFGRWDALAQAWKTDAVSSLCIDAGDPSDIRFAEEPQKNGFRINIGAYGGTRFASRSYTKGWLMIVW